MSKSNLIPIREQSASSQVDYVKSQSKRAKRSATSSKSLKFYYNHYSRKLGYRNYDELNNKVKQDGLDWINKYREECLIRPFDANRDYYLITGVEGEFTFNFYSECSGWSNDGYELRRPSFIKPEIIVPLFREELSTPLSIIHHGREFTRWLSSWHNGALISHEVMANEAAGILNPRRCYNRPKLDDIV